MSDEITPTPTVPATPAVTSTKPYDMLDAYVDEAPAETPSEVPSPSVEVEPSKEEAETSVSEEKPEATEEETEVEAPTEEAKAKEGDKVDDGFEEVPVSRIVNGKEVKFKVKDAIEAFVQKEEFNRNMDRRSTALAQKEKAWEKEVNTFGGQLSKVFDILKSGDFVNGVNALANTTSHITGLDVVELEKGYFDQVLKLGEAYGKLSGEQKDAYWAKRKASVSEAKLKSLQEESAKKDGVSQLEGHIKGLQEKNGISDGEFWGAYELITKEWLGEGKPFKDTSEIKPEHVIELVTETKHHQKVDEALKALNLTEEWRHDAVSMAVKKHNPNMTVSEIVQWLKEAGFAPNTASPTAVENLNRKAEKSKTRFSQGSSTKKENGIPEGYDKEILEELYRHQPRVYARPQR